MENAVNPELIHFSPTAMLVIIGLFIVFSAFFSAAEIGVTAVSRARIHQLKQQGNRSAKIVTKLRTEKESLIGAILLGNNVMNIAASTLATSLAIHAWGEEGVLYVTLIMTILVLVFAEVMPKTYALQFPEPVALAVAPLLRLIVIIFSPITYAIKMIVRATFRLFGVDVTGRDATSIPASDVIRGVIDLHHQEGNVIKQDRDMLGSILDLVAVSVSEIMTHRKRMETINADLPGDEIIRLAISSMHSRIPLWQGNSDNIIGVLHVKNLLREMGARGRNLTNQMIIKLAAKPWFIPETTSLKDQLLAFRQRQQHFALVVDEYGGLKGLVTLEDILEEIVGEIDDEHDQRETSIQRKRDGSFVIDGNMTIRDTNRKLEWSLPDENASTLAGLVIHNAEIIPDIGEQFEFHGYSFIIEGRNGNQLTKIRVQKIPELIPDSDNEAEDV